MTKTIIDLRKKKIVKEFYSRVIEYHQDENLRQLFRQFVPFENKYSLEKLPNGVILDSVPNQNLEEDKKKHPDKIPIERYNLVYGQLGFIMIEDWHGDFFPHRSYTPFKVEAGKLVYENKETNERGVWPMLDAFPKLDIAKVDIKIKSAISKAKHQLETSLLETEREFSTRKNDSELIEEVLKALSRKYSLC